MQSVCNRPRAFAAVALGLACLGASIGAPIAAAAPAAPAAPAVPAALTAAGPFSAQSDSQLLTVDLPSLAGVPEALLPQTNVVLGDSQASADSDADPRTAASAGTTGSTVGPTNILGSPVQLDSADATAPPSTIDDPDPVIPVPASPLLTLGLLDAYAEANWVSDTECVAGDTPLSLASQSLAEATLLEVPEQGAVVDTNPGAVSSEADTFLVPIPGENDPRAVYASSTANVAGVHVLFDNLAVDVQRIDGEAVPDIAAQASGIPGGASVTFADYIVTVTAGGGEVITLDSREEGDINSPEPAPLNVTLETLVAPNLTQLFPDLGLGALDPVTDPVLQPLGDAVGEVLDALKPIAAVSIPRTIDVADDGTFAEGSTALLRVELLAPTYPEGATEPIRAALDQVLSAIGLAAGQPLGVIDLGPSHALAEAPAGGITCGSTDDSNPLELQKAHSGPAIPGSSFDYTIAVGNVSDCVMNPVRVTDTLVGPPGTTIALTEPAGATITDQGGGTFQIDWANVGPIPPDGRVSLRIRVNVPTNATIGFRYSDTVTSTASIVAGEGCTARDVTRTVTLDEPVVVGAPGGPCNITGSRKGKSHLEVYPGESFVYFINILNAGSDPCTNVTVVDPIDPRLTFESCSDGCTFSAPNATWNLGTLAPGQSVTLRVHVKVNLDATGNLANTATIDTDETGPTTVRVDGPLITDNSVLSGNTPAEIPDRTLARTGSAIPASLGLVLGALAVGVWQLRRRLAPAS